MTEPKQWKTIALGLLGAAVGGTAGYFAFFWLVQQGLYGLMLPPALLGITAGLFARRRSMPLALICGAAGLGLGLFTEWRFRPFVADEGFVYFVTHIYAKNAATLVMLALGTYFSFSLALWRGAKPPV